MNESITRIQFGPSGITVYTNLGMHSKFTEEDEARLFSEHLTAGFAAIEELRQKKKNEMLLASWRAGIKESDADGV